MAASLEGKVAIVTGGGPGMGRAAARAVAREGARRVGTVGKPGGGAIVNTASVAGLVGQAGIPAYVASKHGIIGLTRTAALEHATTGIRVNCVCPGVIRTPLVEAALNRSPENEAAFLAMEPVGR